MRWIFQTYRPLEGGRWPTRCKLMGFPVWNRPNLFVCVANDIVTADKLFESATGIDPCKPPKGADLVVTRFCPELRCNQSQYVA